MIRLGMIGLGMLILGCQSDADDTQRTIVNCDQCNVIINDVNSEDWQINRNELICVDSLGTVTGNITTDGGKFCSLGRVTSSQVLLNTGELSSYDTLITEELIINDRAAFFNYGYLRVLDRLIINSDGALYQQGVIEVEGDFINNGEVSGLQDEECYPIIVRGQSVNNSSGSVTGNLDFCDSSAATFDTADGSVDATVTFCNCNP